MIITLLANGFEELEALTPVDILRRNNADIRTASISDDKNVIGTHGIQVVADLRAEDVPIYEIEMLILPGGMPGVTNLESSPITQKLIEATLANGGHIAAICAAPSILGKRGMLNKTKSTCFPGFEDQLLGAILTNKSVVTDGNFTTAKDFTCSAEFSYELLRILASRSTFSASEETAEDNEENEEQESNPFDELRRFLSLSNNDVPLFDIDFVPEFADGSNDTESCEPACLDSDGGAAEEEHKNFATESDESLKKFAGYLESYELPSTELLSQIKKTDAADKNAECITETSKRIAEIMDKFGVEISIRGCTEGPRVIRYEIVPARGVTVNKVLKYANDVKYELGQRHLRVLAPIPGKAAIGFEIPNAAPDFVSLRSMLEDEAWTSRQPGSLLFPVGVGFDGKFIYGNVSKFPHALVCGATGMGKSNFIHSMICSLMMANKPNEVKFILVDPKKVEFKCYYNNPYLLVPVVTDAGKAAAALHWAVEEMERRYGLIETEQVRNLDAYNEKIASGAAVGDKLPKIVIVIDEFADLMLNCKSSVEDAAVRIAQKARAAGIHLVIGTQCLDTKVITSLLRANIPTKIAFKTTSLHDSKLILDCSGAEDLLDRGDMLYRPIEMTSAARIQAPFISECDIDAVMNKINEQFPEYCHNTAIENRMDELYDQIINPKKHRAKAADEDCEDDTDGISLADEQFAEAVMIAIKENKASTSLLQKRMSIGYGKAAKYIDKMTALGFVSEPSGAKPRNVLITEEKFKELLSREEI